MEASNAEDARQALRRAMSSGDAALLEAAIGGGEAAGVSRILLESARRTLADLEASAPQRTAESQERGRPEAGGPGELEAEGSYLPPMPAETQNRIAELDTGPYANPYALLNEAFYIPSLNGLPEDRSVFERLMTELNFHTCWLNTGMQFSREICLGDDEVLKQSPTYRALVRRVSDFFGVRVVRTLVNLYRDGEDWCNLHHDQYHQGGYPIDLTVGSSFGDARRLIWVEKNNDRHRITIPQRNGDVFAFSDHINANWRHMVPRERQCGPRISVIVWCTRNEDSRRPETQEEQLGHFPHMLYYNPRGSGKDYMARPQRYGGGYKGGKGRGYGGGGGRGGRDGGGYRGGYKGGGGGREARN